MAKKTPPTTRKSTPKQATKPAAAPAVIPAAKQSAENSFPDAPAHLKPKGVDAWNSGRALWNEGIIHQRDLVNWLLFAEAVDEKAHCEDILKRDGEYQDTQSGVIVQHPALKRRQQAEAIIRKYSVAFGMIPDARKKRPAAAQGVSTRKR